MEARPSRLPAPSWPLEPAGPKGIPALWWSRRAAGRPWTRWCPGMRGSAWATCETLRLRSSRKPGSHRSDDRRDTGSHRRPDGDGDDHQRHASWPSPEIPGRRRGGDPGDERAGGGHLGALARDPRAERYGRRPEVSYPGISPGETFEYRYPIGPIRDVLVPQPLGIPGATGPLRPARHRTPPRRNRSSTTGTTSWYFRTGPSRIRTGSWPA